jgi:hypothetical protein
MDGRLLLAESSPETIPGFWPATLTLTMSFPSIRC